MPNSTTTTTTGAVSPDPCEMTRVEGARIEAEILRRLSSVTQARAAEKMGLSGSTISRTVEDVNRVAHLLAAIGLKVCEIDAVVMDKAEQVALKRFARNWLDAELSREDDL